MDVTAIICEYNPFHKGHEYQLNKVKELCPDTKIVSIMSPNFVQRGRPAVFDKFVRGECAVRCGADLAISMPQVFAILSAEGFAEGGVRLAKKLGATALAFGVETDDLERLTKIAGILLSEEFEGALQKELTGSPFLSFPAVRQKALEAFVGKDDSAIISTHNNILAVEYIKASMRYCPDMKLIPIKRVGKGYGDLSESGELLSASAIRNVMKEKREWQHAVPKGSLRAVNSAIMLDGEKYDSLLFSALSVGEYDRILWATNSKELANTISTAIKSSGDYKSFREKLSRKKFPETRIDRSLISFLLGIKGDEYMHSDPEYATLLAMNGNGRSVVKQSDIPIVSKFGETKKLLGKQIEKERLADRIWARCTDIPDGEKYFIDKKPYIAEDVI